MINEQYTICWVDLEPTRDAEINKIRPCVILSPSDINKYLAAVIIAPITSKTHAYPMRVRMSVGDVSGWIVVDQMRAIDKRRLCNEVGILSAKEIKDVKNIIKEMLVD